MASQLSKMTAVAAAFIAIAFVTFGLSLQRGPELATATFSQPEIDVLHALFGSDSDDTNGYVHLSPETDVGLFDEYEEWSKSLPRYLAREMPSIDDTTVASFIRSNARPSLFPRTIDLGPGAKIDFDDEIREIFDLPSDGWDIYYERHPNGYGSATVSRVGFNAENTEALVYYGCQSHWLGGSGFIYLYRLQEGRWQQVSSVMIWIS